MDRITLTIAEVSSALGVSERTIYEMARTGRLPGALRLGGRWLVRRDLLEKALEARATPAPIEQCEPNE